MLSRYFLAAFGLALSFTASAAIPAKQPDKAGAPAAAKLTAAQIVDRNVVARGGLAAWRAVHTLVLSGQMEAGGTKNESLPFVLEMKRPHKSRLEIRFEGKTALQVYDGEQGWKVRPFLGRDDAEPFTPEETKLAADWGELDGPLVDYAAKGTTVALEGMEDVEKHPAYRIKLTMKDGAVRHVWIDASTFLERKIEGDQHRLDGKMRNVAIYYRDYKAEHGLMVPHVLETVIEGGRMPHTMTIDRVTVNASLDNALFGKPQLQVAAASTK
ncbi:MAG TPA: outer membrane lipoprotein-sorting protein [Parasulfuritortus sp.]